MAKSVIVAEFKSNSLAAVEVTGKGSNQELVHYLLCSYPEEGLSIDWVKDVWQKAHLSHQQILYLIPSEQVSYKNLTIPLLTDDQIDAAIKLELENSFGTDCLYRVIHYQKQEQMILVKVAIIKKAEYEKVHFLLKEAGFEILWSGLRIRGLQNFLNFNRELWDNDHQIRAYLDLADTEAEFGVVSEETILFKRDIQPGFRELISDEPELLNDFLDELQLSVAAYRKWKEEEPEIERIICFGKAREIPELTQVVEERLGLKLEFSLKSGLTGIATKDDTMLLAPLIGLALEEVGWCKNESLRFYSKAKQNSLRYKQLWIEWRVWFLMAALVVAGILLGIKAGAVRESKNIQWLIDQETQLKLLQRDEQATRVAIQKINALDHWRENRGRELEFMAALQRNLIEGTIITSIIIEDGMVKDLSGVTLKVSLLLNHLKKDPLLKELKLKGTITISEKGEMFHLEGPLPEGSGR